MGGYYYLVSSLPMLTFDEVPAINCKSFMEACQSQLSSRKFKLLEAAALIPEEEKSFPAGSAADKWRTWEICLRNRIAAHRAGQGRDISDCLLEEKDCFSEIESGVQEAFGLKTPLEREKYFDRMRWQRLDDLEAGHQFDLDRLCIYKIKLLVLEKWTPRKAENGTANLEAALNEIEAKTSGSNVPVKKV